MNNFLEIENALISVSDKKALLPFAKQLVEHGKSIYSTGGTASFLNQHKITTIDLSSYTGFPEILNGRVKTLHPKIYAGLLHRGEPDTTILAEHNVERFQLIIVNLYPFAETITHQHSLAEAIENIDIGGVSLIRAAAKNYEQVAIITDPSDYPLILEVLQNKRLLSLKLRQYLAAKAFRVVAHYDSLIANYFTKVDCSDDALAEFFSVQLHQSETLRYGENPHQKAAWYGQPVSPLQGKALSYNNMIDAYTAVETLEVFQDQVACVIIKHANPCGIGTASDGLSAYQLAFKTDPTSAFGGIIAFNCTVDKTLAEAILNQQFLEVLIAQDFTKEALLIAQEKPNIRLLLTQSLRSDSTLEFRSLANGVLLQERDRSFINIKDLQCVTQIQPTQQQLNDLILAWKASRTLKSNAIVIAKDNQIFALSGGQTSRIDAVKLAFIKAQDRGHDCQSAVMASDGFFPFKDNIEFASQHGITAIIQPGGSVKDIEVIQACDDRKLAMVFTGIRHFKH